MSVMAGPVVVRVPFARRGDERTARLPIDADGIDDLAGCGIKAIAQQRVATGEAVDDEVDGD